jgi:hypothetical protein
MPNRRFDWHEHIKDIEGEYQAARVAVDRDGAGRFGYACIGTFSARPIMSVPSPNDDEPETNAPDPTAIPDGPPEEEFWERYNKRLEFPLSTVSAVFLHVLVAAFLIVTFTVLMKKTDKSGVPVSLVPDMGGLDDEGTGSAGSGGVQDPLKEGKVSSLEEQLKVLPDPSKLPEIKQDLRDSLKYDTEGNIPVSDFNAPAYAAVDRTLRDKLLGIGAKKGTGPGAGTGDDGTKGAGPGGTGANSTRARSLRWVMRFRTNSGDDYVNQLAAMGAVILVPLPSTDNKRCLYFTNLRNPGESRMATDDDLRKLTGQIKFSDTRPESVRSVCEVLGVKESARSFWAFFPKNMEEEVSRKEIGYRNRRPEQIEETIFRVIVRGGTYEIVVDDQTPKR